MELELSTFLIFRRGADAATTDTAWTLCSFAAA